ncbi:CBS domain protein [uncultured archaeon]|nr:CBS domain protein [uncultured archaeon]
MRVKDIMEIHFASFEVDDGLDRILETFSKYGVTSAPVFAKGELVGIVNYADLAKFFSLKEGTPLLQAAQAERKGTEVNASMLARKAQLILTPDQPVSLAIPKLISSSDCAPVMNRKKVVGVVWPAQVVEFFLAERAKTEAASGAKEAAAKNAAGAENSTTIDRMLEIVRRDGQTTPKKVAKELGITEPTAEDLAKLLGKHRLAELKYSFMSGMVIKRIEHGSK